MLLTSIGLTNFKCFAGRETAPLAPLTLIFGKNNSGKSSILHSVLLLRQSLDAPGYGPRLNLNGALYEAGSFVDLVHDHRTKSHVGLEFGFADERFKGTIDLEFSNDEREPYAPRLSRISIKPVGTEPIHIRRGVGQGGPYEMYVGTRKVGRETHTNFRFPLNRFLPLIGSVFPIRHTKAERSRETARRVVMLFDRLLGGVRAVGPFRQRPERRYEYRGRTADIPDVSGKQSVMAIIEDATRRKSKSLLTKRVNHWLAEVGRVKLMPIREISKQAKIYQIRLRDMDSGRWASFSDVGFGLGQAFPVIVEGLRTPPGRTFIVQEPEIHLHPDAQLAMADFLVDLALDGRQVIAETHSENILLRVRKLVAASKKAGVKGPHLRPEDVSVLHVRKDKEGRSHIARLNMDELGQVSQWPSGFMEEASAERMLLLREIAKRSVDAK